MKIKHLAALGLAGALVLAACGDDDSGGSGADTTAGTAATTAAGGGATTAAPSGDKQTIRLWLNGGDTPDELVTYLEQTFEAAHPDADLVFERQQWTGIVEKLTTALSSNDSPDVVEFGNTQAQAFTAAGAVLPLDDMKAELGGDDLLTSLVESGTYDGTFYAAPYYAGARIVLYNMDQFEAAGVEVPTTLQEFIDAGIKLKEANADVPNYSGIYFPGKYWLASLPFIWEAGGDIATQKDGEWVGELSSDPSVKGLTTVQEIMEKANGAPADSDEAKDYIAFCNGEVGMLMAPGWKMGQILNKDDGCPELEGKIGAFALPGATAGSTAPVFLGGSNIGVSANSKNPELAKALVALMLSDEFQSQLASKGLLPAKKSLLDSFGTTEADKAQAAAAKNSRFTPSSEKWAGVEAANILPDMLVGIAKGGAVKSEASTADDGMTAILNG